MTDAVPTLGLGAVAPRDMRKPQPGGPSTKAATEPGLPPMSPNSRRSCRLRRCCRLLNSQRPEAYDLILMTLNPRPRVAQAPARRVDLHAAARPGASRETPLTTSMTGSWNDFGLHSREKWRPMV